MPDMPVPDKPVPHEPMPDRPIHDPRIREAMEACRPGSDDLADPAMAFLAEKLAADPELAEAFGRLQLIDASVAEAFRDVPVPEGLADRINARLAAVRNGQKAAAEAPQAGEVLAFEVASSEPVSSDRVSSEPDRSEPVAWATPRLSRRWVLAGAGSLVAAASLVLGVWLASRGPQVRELQEVCDAARSLFDADPNAMGELVAKVEPPAAYPLGPDFDVSKFPAVRWRRISNLAGCKGVVYDLGEPGAPRAALYVVDGGEREYRSLLPRTILT
jgi:hypothetical protein